MKHQQTAVQAAPSMVTRKSKPVHSVAKAAAAGRPASKASGNGGGRLEMIRQTAYSFYAARSYEGGHALDDWLRAEAQVDRTSGARHA